MRSFVVRKRYLVIALVVVVVGLMFLKSRQGKTKEYETTVVSRGRLVQALELSGEVDAKEQVELRFSAGGLVTYLPFKEGDRVRKGQTVAALDSRQLQKTLERQLNTYAIQRGTFDKVQDTYKKEIEDGAVDQELRRILETAQYQLGNSVIDVELQDLVVRLSRLYAPFSGIITASAVKSAGVVMLPTDSIEIVNPETLYFKAELDEADLALVHPGQQVRVVLDAFPEEEVNSTISDIAFAAKETSTGTVYEVSIPLTSFQDRLRLALNGTARVVMTEKDNILKLPLDAVREEGGEDFVYVPTEGAPAKREVEIGVENDEEVEIVRGLQEGERVIMGTIEQQ